MSNSRELKLTEQEEKELTENLSSQGETNTSTEPKPIGDNGQVQQPPKPKVPRKRVIGEIINIDGVLYRLRKFTGHHKDIVLRRMSEDEINKVRLKIAMRQERAIRNAKARIKEEHKNTDVPEDKEVVIEPPPSDQAST